MKIIGTLAIFAFFTVLATHVYITPMLGFPLAAYWSFAFFAAAALTVFFLRNAFERDLAPVNFLNRDYYRSFSVLLTIFVLLPTLVFLLRIFLDDAGDVSTKRSAATVFIGRVYGIENVPFTMVRFDVIKKISGDEEGFSIVETGLVMPKDCLFAIEIGDTFKVYLQKSITSGYVLTCNGMQRLEKTDEMER